MDNEKLMEDYENFKAAVLSELNKMHKQIEHLNGIVSQSKYEIGKLRQTQDENTSPFKRLYVNERISTLESKTNAFQNQVNALQDQMSSLRGRW